VVPAAGGPAAPVSFASPAFTPDMIAGSTACGWRDDKVVFSMRHEDNLAHIYEAPFSFAKWQVTGPPHRLTFGTAQEESPSVASDGRLAFASLTTNLDVYSLPLDANRGIPNGPPEKLTHDIADDAYASLSSDGRTLAFQSYRSGRPEIWLKHLADGKEERLASGESPVVSPDGTSVAFIQDLKRLMIIPTEGGVMREISSRPLTAAAWSPDQRFLLAAEYGKPRVSIEVLDIGSGKTIGSLAHPREHLFPRGFSPDGGWISFSKASPEGQILMIAPFRLSSPPGEEEWFAVTDSFTNDFQPRWSVDGRILYFISERDGFACIWARRMDVATQRPTGDPFAVLHLHGASRRMRTGVRPLSVARDKLAFSMEERAGSIWTLQFR